MKKILSILCAVTFLFALLGMTTFAKDSTITISEDYKTLSVGAQTYSRFDISMLEVDWEHGESNIVLSETQQKDIEDIGMQSSSHRIVISATIDFKDGSSLRVTFLRDDYFEVYETLVNSRTAKHEIDFIWPEYNIVTAEGKDLFGEVVTLEKDVIEECDTFEVTVSDKNGGLSIVKGALLMHEDDYYYLDYTESNIEDGNRYLIADYDNVIIHRVADEKLLQKLDAAKEEYWESEFGFFDNDNFTESISAIFLIIVFAFIPLAILILFVILATRSKGIYKKMCRATYLLCGVELVIFAIIMSILA